MRSHARLAPLLLALALPIACHARPSVNGERALERVRHQVAMGPRVSGTPGNVAMRAWIVSELSRLGARVERQAFTDSSLGHPLALENIIGHYGPAAARRIVVC